MKAMYFFYSQKNPDRPVDLSLELSRERYALLKKGFGAEGVAVIDGIGIIFETEREIPGAIQRQYNIEKLN